MQAPRRFRYVRLALLGCLLLALASAPTHAASPQPSPARDVVAPELAATPRALPSTAVAHRAPRREDEPGVRALDEPRFQRQAFVLSSYWDVCDDASEHRIDARAADITEDTEREMLGFFFTSCLPWSKSDLRGGSIEWYVYVPGGRGDGFDYVVILYVDPADDELSVRVLSTPSDDPETWRTTYFDYADRFQDVYGIVGVVPYRALGYNVEFAFDLAVWESGDGPRDVLPDAHEDLLLYPYSCNTFVQLHATVVPRRGDLDRVRERLRARGFEIGAVARAGGAVEVRGVSDARLSDLAGIEGVASVRRPVTYRKLRGADDPWFTQQWNLPQVNAPQAWDVTTRSRLPLAVVDDGVDATRPDLAARVDTGLDAFHDRPLARNANSDRGGHGTAVASVAAARGDNGEEIAGVDWGATIVPYRVFDAADCTTENVIAFAIEDATNRGIPVVNVSLGGSQPSRVIAESIRRAYRSGTLVVAAVGNEGTTGERSYPAAVEHVVGVGATTSSGAIAGYSNRGAHVDIVAPGGSGASGDQDVPALWYRDEVATVSGTSFAAPHVAAGALLYKSLHPHIGAHALSNALLDSARDAGPAGRDDTYGHGLLDLAALLAYETPQPQARDTDDSCPPGEVPEDGFADAEDSVHEASIDCVVWWEVATGTSRRTYSPANAVTRAQMASFIARLVVESGGDLPSANRDHFSDDDDSHHEDSINRLATAGIVAGKGDGTYAPRETVFRDQMATFLVKAFEFRTGASLTTSGDYFPDDDANTHEGSVNRAAEAGFTGGSGEGYRPRSAVRRDQMASFLARVLDLLVEDGHATRP